MRILGHASQALRNREATRRMEGRRDLEGLAVLVDVVAHDPQRGRLGLGLQRAGARGRKCDRVDILPDLGAVSAVALLDQRGDQKVR